MSGWFRLAAFLMLSGVGLGAFGAHGLKEILSEKALHTYQTGVFYHFIHALGLFVVALAATRGGSVKTLHLAGTCFVVGISLFSGSLYLLAVTGVRWLGAITPVGGVLLMLGWAALAAVGSSKDR